MAEDVGFPKTTYDLLFRLVMIGDSGVGKTALLLRYADETFEPSFISTIGIDFRIKTITVEGKRIKLQIWDTAGQEQFHSVATSYFRNAHGILLVYDVCSAQSFMQVTRWMDRVTKMAPATIRMVLVGNKCDAEDSVRVIEKSKGEALAKELDIPFMETSAKIDYNVDVVFELLTMMVLEVVTSTAAVETQEDPASNAEVLVLKKQDEVTPEKRRRKCCKST